MYMPYRTFCNNYYIITIQEFVYIFYGSKEDLKSYVCYNSSMHNNIIMNYDNTVPCCQIKKNIKTYVWDQSTNLLALATLWYIIL